MCGIVGLFVKQPKLEPQLGALLAMMLDAMTSRGPDSAGFAIYGNGATGRIKLSLRGSPRLDLASIRAAVERVTGSDAKLTPRASHAILEISAAEEAAVRAALAEMEQVTVVGSGERMEIYKEVGFPTEVGRRFGLASMIGSHGIGHTRMATESAITTAGAHPFSTGRDQCLVHNGSLSNHNHVRRALRHEGIEFATDNDTEVAAGYLTWRMREGASLSQALTAALDDLDGFYTFVMGTRSGFAVLRDPIACKPAVMAETDDYVAFGSEYSALAHLPDIARAEVWEPEPGIVYSWERPA